MEKKKLLLATSNKGKIAELQELLKDSGYEILGLDNFPDLEEIEENGQTFAENALLKARAAAAHSGLLSLADDSGLSVDFLNGQPGVRSARYGQDWPALEGESRDQRNIRKLLHVLQDVPPEQRGASFMTVMAAVHPDGREILTEGQWRGELLREKLGENGFGYDPIFWDAKLNKSAAQLTREEKNAHSHRGKALAAMLQKLPDLL